ncbi:MAG: hypothetical protein R2856_19895 [Caldilineaceae bacterium]
MDRSGDSAMLAVAWLMGVNGAAPALAQEGTTITVDTSAIQSQAASPTPAPTPKALFFPAADGNCTLRRALRRCVGAARFGSAHSTSVFNSPAGEAVDGVWTVQIEDELLQLFRKNLGITERPVISTATRSRAGAQTAPRS